MAMKIRKIAQSSGIIATIVDKLTSSSKTDALSANQGKILDEKITANKTDVDNKIIEVNSQLSKMIPNNDAIQGVDINDINVTSYNYCNACLNTPTGSNGYLFTHVYRSNYIYQRYINYAGSSYERVKNGGTWNNWIKIAPIDIIESENYWTPQLNTVEGKAPDVEYITRVGRYKKIGKIVFIDFYIRGKITALNGTNNYALIKRLPYVPSEQNGFGQSCFSVGVLYGAITSNDNITFDVDGNGDIRIQGGYGSYATTWKVTTTDYFELGGSGFYFVN